MDIPKIVAVNLFIKCLWLDIRQFVLNFSPLSLASTTCSARLQEAMICTLHENALGRDPQVSLTSTGSYGCSMGYGTRSSSVVASKAGLYQSSFFMPFYGSGLGSNLNPLSAPSFGLISKPTRQLSKHEMDD